MWMNEHLKLIGNVEQKRIFVEKVTPKFKKKLYSKDWYWNGTKLEVYED